MIALILGAAGANFECFWSMHKGKYTDFRLPQAPTLCSYRYFSDLRIWSHESEGGTDGRGGQVELNILIARKSDRLAHRDTPHTKAML